MEKINVLIFGLPGSGKTTLAQELRNLFNENKITNEWFNADMVRQYFDDWDFSEEGRLRQVMRMKDFSNQSCMNVNICDFVCPTNSARIIFDAKVVIWVDTIKKSKYKDTNALFEKPFRYNIRVTNKNAKKWARIIFDHIKGTHYDCFE